MGVWRNRFRQSAGQRLLFGSASWSFDGTAKISGVCGLSVSDNWIQDVCQQQAAQMEQQTTAASATALPPKPRRRRIHHRRTSVNTWEGWREMRLSIFPGVCGTGRPPIGTTASCRPRVRVAFAAIEQRTVRHAQGQWASLGHDTSQLTVCRHLPDLGMAKMHPGAMGC
jgi:hypothetical protein